MLVFVRICALGGLVLWSSLLSAAEARLDVAPAVPVAPDAKEMQRFPDVAAPHHTDNEFLVVWQDGPSGEGGDSNITGMVVGPRDKWSGPIGMMLPPDRDTRHGNPFPICTKPGNQERPVVAAATTEFIVAWQDYRSGKDADIYARILQHRKPEGPEAEDIPIATGEGTQCRPAVAADADGFLVVWQAAKGQATYHVFARQMTSTGGQRGGGESHDLGAGHSPAVACADGKYLVVWEAEGGRGATVKGVLIPRDGQPGKPFDVMRICTNAPSVAAGKKGFAVVASCQPVPNPWGWGGPSGFAAARVGFDGSTPDASVDYGYYNKDLAARARSNILDSSQWKRKPDQWPAGMVGGFPGTDNDHWPHLWSTVAPLGDGFVSAWVSRKIRNRWELHEADLFAATFTAEPWAVRPVGGLPAAATECDESYPRLASDGRHALLVYEQVDKAGRIQVVARAVAPKSE